MSNKRDAGYHTRQAVEHNDIERNQSECNRPCHNHRVTRTHPKGRGNRREVLGLELERERTAVNLVRKGFGLLRSECILAGASRDDRFPARNLLVDVRCGDHGIVHPDRNFLPDQAPGSVRKQFRALAGQLERDNIFVILRIDPCFGFFNVFTLKDHRPAGVLPEGQKRCLSQFFHSGFRVEVALPFFPGKSNDNAVLIIIGINLGIGDVLRNQTHLDD